MKVLAAFDWKGIPYRIQPVSPQRLEQDLPPPHQVPVLKFGDSVVCDSTKILQFMDERIVGPKFFPPGNDDVVQMDNHLGGVFNAYVLYFNWIDDEGFNRSIRPKLEQKVPRILRCARRHPNRFAQLRCAHSHRTPVTSQNGPPLRGGAGGDPRPHRGAPPRARARSSRR